MVDDLNIFETYNYELRDSIEQKNDELMLYGLTNWKQNTELAKGAIRMLDGIKSRHNIAWTWIAT